MTDVLDDLRTAGAPASAPAVPVLELDRVQARLSTPRGALTAVDGVSLRLGAGETIGIVGESGSGKSVLMRTVMNVLPFDAEVSGTVRFDGADVSELTHGRRRHLFGNDLAMSFQDSLSSLNPVRRVGQQIADPLRYHRGLPRRAARARALEVLELVRIAEPQRRIRQYPHELSGGMRQRVMLAMAIACEPKVLIADEPTTALDVTVQGQILDLLAALQHELGMAMILISHDLSVVAGRTDRVFVMYGGQVVEQAPTARFFAAPRHPYTRALIDAAPSIDTPAHTPLPTIAGTPVDMTAPPAGCRFAARCPRVHARCLEAAPPLIADGDAIVACWAPIEPPVGVPASSASGA